MSSSPTSSPKAKMATVTSVQKSSQVGATQLLKRPVQRTEAMLTHKQTQGNSLSVALVKFPRLLDDAYAVILLLQTSYIKATFGMGGHHLLPPPVESLHCSPGNANTAIFGT